MIKEKCFSHPHKGYSASIKAHYTCQSSYVIYIIECRCGLLYVGETTQKVREQIARHKYSIREKLDKLPLARHFVEKGYSVSQPKYMVIDGIPRNRQGGNRELNLRKREVS